MFVANATDTPGTPAASDQSTTRSPNGKPERFVSPDWLVAYLVRSFDIEITVKTLANWRSSGKGPSYISVAGRVRYDVHDIGRWLAAQRRRRGEP
jgi:hypothetical protein